MAWSRYHFHLLILSVAALLAASALVVLAISTDPATASPLVFICMYAAFFTLVFGVSMSASLFIRQRYVRTLYAVNSAHALRQSLLVSSFLTVSLLLSSHSWLTWWSELILIATVIILELFLVSRR
jgi:hypothetical protein